jgi:hypothetical protein
MANVFSRSLGQLNDWLQTNQGRLLQAREPAPTPTQPWPTATTYPTVANDRSAQFAPAGGAPPVAANPTRPIWNPYGPSPFDPRRFVPGGGDGTSTGTSGTWGGGVPAPSEADLASRIPHGAQPSPELYQPPVAGVGNYPTITSEGQPYQPQAQLPQGYTSPTNEAAMAAQTKITHTVQSGGGGQNKVTHTVDSPTHKTVVTAQAKPPPGQTGSGGDGTKTAGAPAASGGVSDFQARFGGSAPAGPAPAVPAPGQTMSLGQLPAQGAQNVNLQVPAHPGLLQRIGQTIGHFFGGTLGQNQPPPVSDFAARFGGPGVVSDQTGSSALSGISHALASGRQHVATHGRTAPVSAPAPTPPAPTNASLAYNADWTPTPLGSPDITNPVPGGQSLAYGPYGITPLGSPDITRPIKR